MDLNQIRYFLALAETLNFTRAAEKCGITQPSLSRQIKLLEKELGGQLIRRERGRTHLTDLGKLIYPRLEEALTLTDAALTDALSFGETARETLCIGLMSTIGPNQLQGLMTQLTEQLPHLELRLIDASGDTLVGMLLAGTINTALLALPEYPETLQSKPLYSERYCIGFKEGHDLARLSGVSFSEFAHDRYLAHTECQFVKHFEAQRGKFPLRLTPTFESKRDDWVQAMAVEGLGYCIIPEFATTHSGLEIRPLVEPEIRRTLSLVSVQKRQLSAAERLFHSLSQHAVASRHAAR